MAVVGNYARDMLENWSECHLHILSKTAIPMFEGFPRYAMLYERLWDTSTSQISKHSEGPRATRLMPYIAFAGTTDKITSIGYLMVNMGHVPHYKYCNVQYCN